MEQFPVRVKVQPKGTWGLLVFGRRQGLLGPRSTRDEIGKLVRRTFYEVHVGYVPWGYKSSPWAYRLCDLSEEERKEQCLSILPANMTHRSSVSG